MPKTIIITGASDGIGAAAAEQLAQEGHQVVVVGRSAAKTGAVAAKLGTASYVADFADLSQVRRLGEELLAAYPTIDVLANNAGGLMGGGRTLTTDGHERTFQVNHLAPFLLTTTVMPALIAGRATVIQTSSSAAKMLARFDIDDLENANDYSAQRAYGNSKLANILFTSELQRRYGDQGVAAAAFHPGVVASNFANQAAPLMRFVYESPLKRLLTTPEKGADQLVWLAQASPGTTFEPGRYYESRKVASKVSPQAQDAELARQLWERSAALV